MTQEEKQLLLKDLCARLPYGVKVEHIFIPENNGYTCEMSAHTILLIPNNEWLVRPYLRSMSSMTEEEKKEYALFYRAFSCSLYERESVERIDWLNAHHFDYRGLIEKGLALEAPENMYKDE